MEKLLIGLDFGTDSVRALLVTANGHELVTEVVPYRRWQKGLYTDAARSQYRQHPRDYLEGMEQAVKAVMIGRNPAEVVGIGIDTTGSTPCPLDRNGTPLALLPAFADNPHAMFHLWKDHSAVQEAADINRVAKNWGGVDYTMYSGGTYSPEWFWSKILHALRHDPAVRAAAWTFAEHCDWITAELAGVPVKAGRCAAGHKAMWHASWSGLPSDDFLTRVDPLLHGWRDRLYQQTYTADQPVGHLSPIWANRLGLPETVVIAGGGIDCHFGAVGAAIACGRMVKVVGTSTCDIIVAPTVDHCVRGICGQVDGSVVPGLIGLEAGQAAFGDIYAWFKRFLGYAGSIDLAVLEQEAATLPISDLLAIDWLNGRRTPDDNPLLTGALFGLTLGTTPPMVYLALMESTAFGSRRIAERFREEGIPVETVIATGGIAHKSPFIMQLCADVMNVDINVVRSEQTCALGGAMFAAVAAGVHPDLGQAMHHMHSGYNAIYTPDPQRSTIYARKYARYLDHAAVVEAESRRGR